MYPHLVNSFCKSLTTVDTLTHIEQPEKCDHNWLKLDITTGNELANELEEEDKNTRIDYKKALRLAEEFEWEKEILDDEAIVDTEICDKTCKLGKNLFS